MRFVLEKTIHGLSECVGFSYFFCSSSSSWGGGGMAALIQMCSNTSPDLQLEFCKKNITSISGTHTIHVLTYIYYQNQPNVGKYTIIIHRWYVVHCTIKFGKFDCNSSTCMTCQNRTHLCHPIFFRGRIHPVRKNLNRKSFHFLGGFRFTQFTCVFEDASKRFLTQIFQVLGLTNVLLPVVFSDGFGLF